MEAWYINKKGPHSAQKLYVYGPLIVSNLKSLLLLRVPTLKQQVRTLKQRERDCYRKTKIISQLGI